MELTFERDEEKAAENLQKNKASVEEAKTVFGDPLQMTFPDLEHSAGEERFVNIGVSSKERVLVVVHTERGQSVRIISSRKATAGERRAYEEGNV